MSTPTTESPTKQIATGELPSALPLPPRLFIPIPPNSESLPSGTRVSRGQSLLQHPPVSGITPMAPVSATIARTTEVERVGAGRTQAVELEVDDGATSDEAIVSTQPPADLPELIERLRSSGVQASRRTSPDLLAQLDAARSESIDTVICSLLDPAGESELHASVFRGYGDVVVAGIKTLADLTKAKRVWCAADTRASSANRAIKRSGLAQRIKVIDIANDYPQADPSLLLYMLVRRRLKPAKLPTDVKVLLLDGLAAAAVGKCVLRGQPMLDIAVEVRESERAACSVRTVPIGTPLRFVLEQLWLKPDRLTLRAGAALRDIRVSADAIFDGVSELSVDVGPPAPVINPDPCIRCGWCVEACPVGIHPAGLLESAQDHDHTSARWYGLDSCIECGICSYVCPSRLPLLGAIRELRNEGPPGTAG